MRTESGLRTNTRQSAKSKELKPRSKIQNPKSKDLKPKSKDQSPKTIAAILLAAGRSERMGAFKPLLPFGNATVIENCLSYLRAGGADSIVIVIGHRADELRRHLQNSTVTFAVNPDPESEMVDSIRCGIAQLPADAAATLIAPVDYPAIPPQVVTTLIRKWNEGARLIVPTWQARGGHPVLIDLCFRRELEALKGSRGLKALFDNHCELVHRVEVNSPYIAHDIDTWDDYTRLYSQIFGQTPRPPEESN